MGIRDLFSRRPRPAATPDTPDGPDAGWRTLPASSRPSPMGTISNASFGTTLSTWQSPSFSGVITPRIRLDAPSSVTQDPPRPIQAGSSPPMPLAPPPSDPEPPPATGLGSRPATPLTTARDVSRPTRQVRALKPRPPAPSADTPVQRSQEGPPADDQGGSAGPEPTNEPAPPSGPGAGASAPPTARRPVQRMPAREGRPARRAGRHTPPPASPEAPTGPPAQRSTAKPPSPGQPVETQGGPTGQPIPPDGSVVPGERGVGRPPRPVQRPLQTSGVEEHADVSSPPVRSDGSGRGAEVTSSSPPGAGRPVQRSVEASATSKPAGGSSPASPGRPAVAREGGERGVGRRAPQSGRPVQLPKQALTEGKPADGAAPGAPVEMSGHGRESASSVLPESELPVQRSRSGSGGAVPTEQPVPPAGSVVPGKRADASSLPVRSDGSGRGNEGTSSSLPGAGRPVPRSAVAPSRDRPADESSLVSPGRPVAAREAAERGVGPRAPQSELPVQPPQQALAEGKPADDTRPASPVRTVVPGELPGRGGESVPSVRPESELPVQRARSASGGAVSTGQPATPSGSVVPGEPRERGVGRPPQPVQRSVRPPGVEESADASSAPVRSDGNGHSGEGASSPLPGAGRPVQRSASTPSRDKPEDGSSPGPAGRPAVAGKPERRGGGRPGAPSEVSGRGVEGAPASLPTSRPERSGSKVPPPARRAGLGAPLPAVPTAGPPVQRGVGQRDAAERGSAPSGMRPPAGALPPETDGPAGTEIQRAAVRPGPVQPVQRPGAEILTGDGTAEPGAPVAPPTVVRTGRHGSLTSTVSGGPAEPVNTGSAETPGAGPASRPARRAGLGAPVQRSMAGPGTSASSLPARDLGPAAPSPVATPTEESSDSGVPSPEPPIAEQPARRPVGRAPVRAVASPSLVRAGHGSGAPRPGRAEAVRPVQRSTAGGVAGRPVRRVVRPDLGGEAPSQSAPVAESVPEDGADAAPWTARPLTRTAGAAAPAVLRRRVEIAGAVRPTASAAPPVQRVAASPSTAAPPGPVRQAPGIRPVPEMPGAGPVASPRHPVERGATGSVAVPAPAPPVQRREAALPPPPPSPPPKAPSPSPAPSPAQSTSQQQGRAGGRPDDAELDELARRLIGPLSRLLRAELRTDRERVGRLRDLRTY